MRGRTAAAAVASIAVILPASAHAGIYVVHACGPQAQFENNSWAIHNTLPAVETGSGCGQAGDFGGVWIREVLNGPFVPLHDGDRADIRFAAPSGTVIQAITYQRWLMKHTTDDLQPTLQTAEGAVLETCSIPLSEFSCQVGTAGAGGNPEVTFAGLSTASLSIGVGCRLTSPATQCPAGGGTEYHFLAVLYDASVTLNDPTPPTLAPVSGGLFSGGWLRGVQPLAVTASDASGISGWSADVDGDGGIGNSARSSCDFTFTKPCPDLTNAPLLVNTATLPDGPHTVTVRVFDAANNAAAADPKTVLTDNTAPAAPSLSVTGAASSPTKTVHGTVPVGQASPVTRASYVICNSAGTGCSTATNIPVSGASFSFPITVTRGSHQIKAWLGDQAGNSSSANTGHTTATLASNSAVAIRTRISFFGKVSVTVSAKAPGPIRLTLSITDARGHRVRRITRNVHLRNGRGTVTFHSPRHARHLSAHASYAGSDSWLPGTAKRSVVI